MIDRAIALDNCASWNMQESEVADRKAREPNMNAETRDYWARRAERLDMQAFGLFKRAREMRQMRNAA